MALSAALGRLRWARPVWFEWLADLPWTDIVSWIINGLQVWEWARRRLRFPERVQELHVAVTAVWEASSVATAVLVRQLPENPTAVERWDYLRAVLEGKRGADG